jgi:hypothetical protein
VQKEVHVGIFLWIGFLSLERFQWGYYISMIMEEKGALLEFPFRKYSITHYIVDVLGHKATPVLLILNVFLSIL